MGGTMSELVPSYLDVTKLALASFLARYREPTLSSYRVDLRCYLRWCTGFAVDPLRVTRAQLELFLRRLDGCEYAPATVARRFCTVATFLRYVVIDGLIPTTPPTPSPGRRLSGKANDARCCTRSSSPHYSPWRQTNGCRPRSEIRRV